MGVASQSKRWWANGPWRAAHSLWTHFLQLLRFLGVPSMNPKAPSQQLGHPVRIRHLRSGRLLVHSIAPNCDSTAALSLAPPRATSPHALFLASFSAPDEDADDAADDADVIRLATAHTPHAWLTLERDADALTWAQSPDSAARFALTRAPGPRTRAVSLRIVHEDAAGDAYLSPSGGRADPRITLSTDADTSQQQFALNVVPPRVPLSPGLATSPDAAAGTLPDAPRSIPVRLQAVRSGVFLAAVAGERVREARKRDTGWDVFSMEHDAATGSAILRDALGRPLGFTEDFCGLRAAEGGALVERFAIEEVADEGDDRITLRSRKGYVSVVWGGEVRLERERGPGRNEMFWMRLALPSMGDMSTPRRRIQTGENGLRTVEASVEVPVDAAVAYEVITDYEGFSRFVEDAAESEVLSREGEGRLMVRMVQSHSFLVLTINVAMELDVREHPEDHFVTMEMKKGFGVREYRGIWKATYKAEGRCVLSCEICAAPAIPAPGFLIDGVIVHATSATLSQVRAECIRRVEDTRRHVGLANGKLGS